MTIVQLLFCLAVLAVVWILVQLVKARKEYLDNELVTQNSCRELQLSFHQQELGKRFFEQIAEAVYQNNESRDTGESGYKPGSFGKIQVFVDSNNKGAYSISTCALDRRSVPEIVSVVDVCVNLSRKGRELKAVYARERVVEDFPVARQEDFLKTVCEYIEKYQPAPDQKEIAS